MNFVGKPVNALEGGVTSKVTEVSLGESELRSPPPRSPARLSLLNISPAHRVDLLSILFSKIKKGHTGSFWEASTPDPCGPMMACGPLGGWAHRATEKSGFLLVVSE